MPFHGIPPMFLTAALLVCADPFTQRALDQSAENQSAANGGPENAESGLATALTDEMSSARFDVVASSPLPAGNRIGSRFGYRTSTRTGDRTFHAGVDFLSPRHTPVYAVAGGIVEHVASERSAGQFGGYGNGVVVHHPELNVWTFYAHLHRVDVQVGQVLRPGQHLGEIGSTTNRRFPRMVPHLHFEVRRARADGGSPFPGPYRQYNINPGEWLADLGVRYEHDDDACAHAEGAANEEAPVLVVRARTTETVLADSSLAVASF